jgi:membrane protein involved in colicin uptake
MRISVVLVLGTLVLAGCKREAQEAVARAKGAAADAERAAKDAAAQARNAAEQANAGAHSAADQARSAAEEAAAKARAAADQARAAADGVAGQARAAADDAAARARAAADQARGSADDAAAKTRGAVGAASESARRGLDSASKSVRELTGGDQVQGVLVSSGRNVLDVRPTSGSVRTVHTDDRTQWILHGAAAGRDGFPIGSTVRVTYIVANGEPLATQVEAVSR